LGVVKSTGLGLVYGLSPGERGIILGLINDVLPQLIHLGAFLYLICFLFRDQILLRSFAILGDFAYTAFYFTAADKPLWSAIAWIVPNIGINIIMIFLILRDRQMMPLSDDEMSLFQNLRGLNPGQFRRLIRLGKWQRVETDTILTEEGKDLDRLYYVLAGDVEVDKGGRLIKVEPAVFIGELAYLRKKPATATVRAKAGAVFVSWPHAALENVTRKDEGLAAVLGNLLSNDLAEKVARG
jgi:Cyclic nucleotide-binding domain